MPLLFQKFQAVLKNRTTYRVGLLQTKAYRALKQSTAIALSQFNISTIDWALLGLLYDNKEGLEQSSIASELGVEKPFVTTRTKDLANKGYVEFEKSKQDTRVKFTHLTKQGIKFVDEVEKHLRSESKDMLKGVSIKDIASYLLFLEKIIENSKDID